MATNKPPKIDRRIDQYPALWLWLQAHKATCLWIADGDKYTPTVQGWRVGAGVAIVLLYPEQPQGNVGGWGIATEPNTIDIPETFADAEVRLGIGDAK